MAGKKNGRTETKGSSDVFKRVPIKKDIPSIEDETIARAGRTISSIDTYIAKVQSVQRDRSMSRELFPEIVRIRHFRNLLDSWKRDALAARNREDDKARMSRLQEFVIICNTFSGV